MQHKWKHSIKISKAVRPRSRNGISCTSSCSIRPLSKVLVSGSSLSIYSVDADRNADYDYLVPAHLSPNSHVLRRLQGTNAAYNIMQSNFTNCNALYGQGNWPDAVQGLFEPHLQSVPFLETRNSEESAMLLSQPFLPNDSPTTQAPGLQACVPSFNNGSRSPRDSGFSAQYLPGNGHGRFGSSSSIPHSNAGSNSQGQDPSFEAFHNPNQPVFHPVSHHQGRPVYAPGPNSNGPQLFNHFLQHLSTRQPPPGSWNGNC